MLRPRIERPGLPGQESLDYNSELAGPSILPMPSLPPSSRCHSIAPVGDPIDNQTMPKSPWKQRISRAQELAGQCPCAAEILRFYALIVQFQSDLFDLLEQTSTRAQFRAPEPVTGPPELPELLAKFPAFLSLVENVGPRTLAQSARELGQRSATFCTDLLSEYWAGACPETAATGADQFFARAFLQPYAEFVRLRVNVKSDGYTQPSCPFCGHKPGLGVLRPMGEGGKRSLLCSFCLAEWEFRRIVCPGCGEENHANLPVYTADELAHVRVECCDSCKRYIKTVDLTKCGLANPLVDEIASVPLDLWARERGYLKLQSNLMQL